jgi:Dockerin type I domain/Secretion system C-terminal sorting domain
MKFQMELSTLITEKHTMRRTLQAIIVLAIFTAIAQVCVAQGALDCSKAIELTCGQTINDNTQGSPSNVKTYTGVTWNESGPEDVFTIQVQETSRLIVTLSKLTVNLDVFILESCDASKVLAYGDRKAIYANATPGKYYIVVDGRDNAVGAYSLTVQCETGYPQTGNILWSESFEDNPDKDWNSDYGVWEMGIPTSGPNSAFVGRQCAATKLAGDYPDNVNTRLIRYTSFIVPDASLNPRLRFWHWYSFNCGDYGTVQIKVQGTDAWEDLPEATFGGHSSGVWTYRTDPLSKYAGKTVQIAFFFHSAEACWPPDWDTSSGWYIDNVAVVTGRETVNFPEKWEPMGIKDWNVGYGTWEVGVPTSGPDSAYSPPFCAATVLDGTYGDNTESWLTSPPFKVPSASKQPSLRYRHWYSFNCGDWGQIRIYSKKTWTTLDTYSGASFGWIWPRLDLSTYADSTVMLRFVFYSSEACWPPDWDVDNGWYIDDIEINGFDPCLYTISPTTSPTFPAIGDTGSVNVTATTGCQWTAVSDVNWIKIISGNSGSGNGTVNYSVDPYTGTNPRIGTATIAGQTFTVNQKGVGNGPSITITSPNGGEILAVDSVQTIRWSSSNVVGNVKIEFSNDDGQTWSIIASNTPNAGNFSWTPMQLISDSCRIGIVFDRCLIRISSVADNSIFDLSDARFSLLRKGDVNFDGMVNEIDIQLIIDIALEKIKPTPSQFWAADCNGNNEVNVVDVATAVQKFLQCAKIKIISPNGGEIWSVAVRQNITWDPSIVSNNIIIELSKDAGNSWSPIDSNAVNTGSYSLTPNENDVSNNCLMRITAVGSNISDTSDAVFAITKSPRRVYVGDAAAAPGSTVNVPIILESQANENAVGFSLCFDTSVLSNPQAVKGSDATLATLNTNCNQCTSGRFGINLALPSGQTFAAGKREIVVVSFSVNASTNATMTTIEICDQPIAREVVDANANILPASWVAGKVMITRGYEADVAPRPNGNGSVTTADWVLVGRFAAKLDTPRTDVNEFQRADCAPKDCGDGRVTTADWVQAGLYAAGLQPPVPACGPTSPTSLLVSVANKTAGTRTIRAVDKAFKRGEMDTIVVELDAQGDENAAGFSLNFDPNVLSFKDAQLGNGAAGAALNTNALQKDNGRAGFTLALPTGQKFSAGLRQILVVIFSVNPNTTASSTNVGFGDQPVAREVVDANANILPAIWESAVVTSIKKIAAELPATFELQQNYPNPFNPATTIKFSLPHAGHVTLKVFDLVGREIATLVDKELTAGRYDAHWDATSVESGVYFYQLRAGEFVETKRLVLVK